jgi:hypothetical protein
MQNAQDVAVTNNVLGKQVQKVEFAIQLRLYPKHHTSNSKHVQYITHIHSQTP